MSCTLDVNSFSLLNDEKYLKKIDKFGVRLHKMKSKTGKKLDHLDYSLGFEDASCVIDFIIPKGFPRDKKTTHLLIFKEAHIPEVLLNSEGFFYIENRGIEDWKRVRILDAKVTRVSNTIWKLEIRGMGTYKLWKAPYLKEENQVVINLI